MNEEKVTIRGGLNSLPEDLNDFSHEVVFGSASITELPTGDFFVSEPLGIKDQKNTDFCAGYAGAAVKEDQEAVLLNPEYTWVQAKKILGEKTNNSDVWMEWGIDLRSLCIAAVNKGFIEQDMYPFEYRTDVDRDFIANPVNWSTDLDMFAADHRAGSFFKVDGPYDMYDNMRSVLYKNRAEARSILTGTLWRKSWTSAKDGIISRLGWQEERGEGHALKIFGQVWLDDIDKPGERTLYLAAQLSNSAAIGDAGVFYFPKEVINSEFTYGAYTFKDLPKEEAAILNENGLRIDASRWTKLWVPIWNFIKNLFK